MVQVSFVPGVSVQTVEAHAEAERSSILKCIFDISPRRDDTDMSTLENAVRLISLESVSWGSVPVGAACWCSASVSGVSELLRSSSGSFSLRISCTFANSMGE